MKLVKVRCGDDGRMMVRWSSGEVQVAGVGKPQKFSGLVSFEYHSLFKLLSFP